MIMCYSGPWRYPQVPQLCCIGDFGEDRDGFKKTALATVDDIYEITFIVSI